jgi:hypothetical protein
MDGGKKAGRSPSNNYNISSFQDHEYVSRSYTGKSTKKAQLLIRIYRQTQPRTDSAAFNFYNKVLYYASIYTSSKRPIGSSAGCCVRLSSFNLLI